MTLDTLIILSGALVAFLSIAGFPPSLYKPMFFVLGFFVIALGIIVRRVRGQRETAERLSTRTRKRTPTNTQHVTEATPEENEMGL